MFGMLNATLGIPGLPNLLPEAKINFVAISQDATERGF